MILVGETGSAKIIERLKAMGWGRMYVEKRPNPYDGEPWGFDNAAFLAFKRGEPFPEAAFVKRLSAAQEIGVPYMAVVPDIVAGGCASLQFSTQWRSTLQSVAWPWYLAVQDGMKFSDVAPVVGGFDGVFLGGSDKLKLAAQSWCDFAHDNGKRFHYARAGTIRKMEHAFRVGADSLDSSFPLWSSQRLKLFAWASEGMGLQKEMEFS